MGRNGSGKSNFFFGKLSNFLLKLEAVSFPDFVIHALKMCLNYLLKSVRKRLPEHSTFYFCFRISFGTYMSMGKLMISSRVGKHAMVIRLELRAAGSSAEQIEPDRRAYT